MQTTTNYGLKKPDGTDVVDIRNFNDNADIIDEELKEHATQLSNMVYQTAGGTGTAITLTINGTLVTGYPITFIASANNNSTATTINSKPLYKPGTTTAPNLIAGKAYTVWYNASGDSGNGCFFIKASATGDALVSHVLAGKKFSTDVDTDLVGTLNLSLLVSGNIKAGITINGVTGATNVVDTSDAVLDPAYLVSGYSGYDDGVKKSGTMANRAGAKFQICGFEGITEIIPHPSAPASQGLITGQNLYGATGYIDGNSQIQMSVNNLVPANIVSGVAIGRNSGSGTQVMIGTATIESLGGKYYAQGTVTTSVGVLSSIGSANSSYVPISSLGLSFTPSVILIYYDTPTYSNSSTYNVKTSTNYWWGTSGVSHGWSAGNVVFKYNNIGTYSLTWYAWG